MATGKHAQAICGRCGFKRPYLELCKDGYNKGLYVCRGCRDLAEPKEPNTAENISLKHPRPDTRADITPVTLLADAMEFDTYFGGGT